MNSPLPADLRQRPVENLVAARRHAKDVDRAVRIKPTQTRLDELGLPKGQTGLARGDDNA